jgi:flagellar motility protein MotE (MotC chaperone)
MKGMIPYIVLIMVTFVCALAVVGGIMYFKPGIIKPVKTAADTVAVSAKIEPKESPVQAIKDTLPAVRPDTVQKAAPVFDWKDSVKALQTQIHSQQQKYTELEKKIGHDKSVVDSAQIQRRMQFVKFVESMKAEEAAKVLGNMKDDEVRMILLHVKARQAAKILEAFEPKRAARLMN